MSTDDDAVDAASDAAPGDHSPRHLLETGLLGKPKHGMQRVSDLTAKHEESVDAALPDDLAQSIEDEEYST